jgi:hypothetical protein
MNLVAGSPFGLKPEDDYPLVEQPAGKPGFGENHAFWLLAEDGTFFINAHLNSVDHFWPLRREAITICLPDGKALVEMNEGWGTSRDTIASGGMRARCVQPMRRWRLEYKGTMRETTQAHLARNILADGQGRRVLVDFDADITADAPPFRQGHTDARWAALQNSSTIGLMGGSRYEQLCRARVRLRIHGANEVTFQATVTRTHRAGVRALKEWLRSDWQSALFPSGMGFSIQRFLRDDNTVDWEEASLLHEGKIYPAEILADNWVHARTPSGEPLSIRLHSELGVTNIEGTVMSSIFRGMTIAVTDPSIRVPGPLDRFFGFEDSPNRTLVLKQSCIRYSRNGEVTYGQAERSNYADQYGA